MKTKKEIIVVLLMIIFSVSIAAQQRVVISDKDNQQAHPSAILELVSDDKGFLLPRMTEDEKNAIIDPAESLMIFNTESICIEIWIDGSWRNFWCSPIGCTGFENASSSTGFLLEDPYNDGKDYELVEINKQCWFAENVNIGSRINVGSNQGEDCSDIIKWCYDNDSDNCDIYGGFYQWNMAMCGSTTEGAQGICPDGWSIPTDDDFEKLEGYLDSTYDYGDPQWDINGDFRGNDAGAKMAGNSDLWEDDDLTGHAEFGTSGFDVIPGGLLMNHGSSANMGRRAYFWTSTDHDLADDARATNRALFYTETKVRRSTEAIRTHGMNIRCIKD